MLNCAQEYYHYKTRQDIEQVFKSYDDTLDASASYMRDQYSFEAWLFINHLAFQMLYAVLQKITNRELTAKHSFNDAMQFMKHIRANRLDGKGDEGHKADHGTVPQAGYRAGRPRKA